MLLLFASCLPLPATSRTESEFWRIASPDGDTSTVSLTPFAAVADTWIALDSTSFRPVFLSRPLLNDPTRDRFAIVSSFQGARYHPEVLRAIGESPNVAAASAGATSLLVARGGVNGVVLDFQEMTVEDRALLVSVARVFADSARAHGVKQVALIVPATDSTSYPAATLARIADVLIVKVFPEHGVSTPAGPIVSPAWFSRRLGIRAGEIGSTRIVAGIPGDGVIWARDSTRRISYSSAMRLAEAAGVTFARDPASQNLHATSTRDGWDIWMVDHITIAALVHEARRFGVTRFAIFGADGMDGLPGQDD